MSKKPKARHEIWFVEWFDAHDGPSDWTSLSTYKVEEVLVQSVGFKVHEDSKYITLACSDDGNNHVGGGIVIPKVNITRTVKMKRS